MSGYAAWVMHFKTGHQLHEPHERAPAMSYVFHVQVQFLTLLILWCKSLFDPMSLSRSHPAVEGPPCLAAWPPLAERPGHGAYMPSFAVYDFCSSSQAYFSVEQVALRKHTARGYCSSNHIYLGCISRLYAMKALTSKSAWHSFSA